MLKWWEEALRRVNLRVVLLVAGTFIVAAGVILLLLPPPLPVDYDPEEDPPLGMSPTVAAGALVTLGGLAAVVLALLNRAWAGPARPAPLSIATNPEANDSADPPPASPIGNGLSAGTEAVVVRLLADDERLMYVRIRDAGGEALQRDIVAWGTFSPAKVSRLLDRLESKGLLVRERYGSTNRVRLTTRTAVSSE